MLINAFINRTQDEYLAFMGIDNLPQMKRVPYEIDMTKVLAQGLGSWAQVMYNPDSDEFSLNLWKDLYKPILHADYLMFHEYTHAYDIDRLANGDKIKHVMIKGYIEYHAAQVELMKQTGTKFYSDPAFFSMTDVVKSPGDDKSVYDTLAARKKDATDTIVRSGFPWNIEKLAMIMGIIFNHLGRISVCERYARDYDIYKKELEDYSVEEQFFGTDVWKLITEIYHDEMSQESINKAMKIHLGILKTVTDKYGLHL